MLLCTKVHLHLPCPSNCFPFRAPEHLAASVSLCPFDPDVSLMNRRKPGVAPSSLPAGQEGRCRLVSSHRGEGLTLLQACTYSLPLILTIKT